MLILAATPGPGVLLVTSQTATHRLRAGLLTTCGIIFADIFFILLVTYGLAALTKNLQFIIIFVNFLGGLYLIFIGVISFKNCLKNKISEHQKTAINNNSSQKSNAYFFLSGFLVTLSNPKAILFYLSFLPAFVDLSNLKHSDVVIIMITAIVTIAPTMMIYAWMSNQAAKMSPLKQKESIISKVAAIMLIIVGCYMLYRSTL